MYIEMHLKEISEFSKSFQMVLSVSQLVGKLFQRILNYFSQRLLMITEFYYRKSSLELEAMVNFVNLMNPVFDKGNNFFNLF